MEKMGGGGERNLKCEAQRCKEGDNDTAPPPPSLNTASKKRTISLLLLRQNSAY